MSRKKFLTSCTAAVVLGLCLAMPAFGAQPGAVSQTGSTARAIPVAQQAPAVSQTSCMTAGSGGFADGEQSFSSGSLESKYRVANANLAATGQPVGLLMHFHGDGAYDFKNPEWSFDGMAEAAARHNMVAISILTPDSATTTWWKSAEANAKWLEALLQQKIFTSASIDLNRIWLVGYSGGTNFISYDVVPDYSKLFCGGGAVLFGGGGTPNDSDEFSPSFLANFKMHFYTGEQDTAGNAGDGYDAISDSLKSAKAYKARGFQVTEEHPANINHNNIPFEEITAQQLNLHAGTGQVAAAASPAVATSSAVPATRQRPAEPQSSAAPVPVAQTPTTQSPTSQSPASRSGVISSSSVVQAPWAR